MLLQHATGPYDPMDQVMEDRLNAILEAAVAQDAAAIKAQFAPNAIAAQPELDSQIEALLDYYAGKSWEIDSPGCMTMDSSNADGTGGRASSFQMHGMILTDRFYRFSLRGIFSGHKKSRQCRHLGIVPAPSGSAYGLCVLCGW